MKNLIYVFIFSVCVGHFFISCSEDDSNSQKDQFATKSSITEVDVAGFFNPIKINGNFDKWSDSIANGLFAETSNFKYTFQFENPSIDLSNLTTKEVIFLDDILLLTSDNNKKFILQVRGNDQSAKLSNEISSNWGKVATIVYVDNIKHTWMSDQVEKDRYDRFDAVTAQYNLAASTQKSGDFSIDDEAGCSSGGPGSTSCSVTNRGGEGCSTSCSGGKYACCNRGTFSSDCTCK